ncbi:MAG: hypothetical protein HYY06_29075 [Deltaproteobacteria bacterium]|nr:hypothetical protein [Deltaproteobacteria bacterium]
MARKQGRELRIGELYSVGHWLYGVGRLEECADVFELLTTYEPAQPRFWFARGAVEQERRRLPEAIAAYSIAALLDEADPWPLLQMGECLLLHGDSDLAVEALGRAVERAGTDHDHAAALERARGFIRYAEVHHGR